MTLFARPNPYHPGRDLLGGFDGGDPTELRRFVEAHGRPLSTKEKQGTARHAALLAAGARVYQTCPPETVIATEPLVRSWAQAHDDGSTVSGEGFDLLELWCRYYDVVHRAWSPSAPVPVLKELFDGMIADELDPRRTRHVPVDGDVVAAAFVFPGAEVDEVIVEALIPDHPQARGAVAACMASALLGSSGTVMFDGHVTDPHFAPLLATLPCVTAGPEFPLDLLVIEPSSEPTQTSE